MGADDHTSDEGLRAGLVAPVDPREETLSLYRFAILHAPSPLGLMPPPWGGVPGVAGAPEVLRAAGLHDAVPGPVRFAGSVAPPPYDPTIHRETGIRNAPAIRSYSERLAAAVGQIMEEGEVPLVLGGDCSILLGCALACGERGRIGLLFVDAHPDLLTPETSSTGGAAGMDLALATGRGPSLLTWLPGPGPLVRQEDVVVLGCAQFPELGGEGVRISVLDRATVRAAGPDSAARQALRHLASLPLDGFWLHLDVDVLDPLVMPAVDSPQPGGLTLGELVALLRPLVQHSGLVGMDMTIYDPVRDPAGAAARTLAELVERVFRVG